MRNRLSEVLPSLVRFAMTLTRSRHDAEDLVQTTCERALSRASQWSPDTKLESWVFRIMQTIWYNEARARNVRARYREAQQESPADAGAPLSDAQVDNRLFLDRVERELFDMSEVDRTVMLLVCVEGLTYKEAAEVTGVPIGTVMSRLARARLHLVARLETPHGSHASNVQRLAQWRN